MNSFLKLNTQTIAQSVPQRYYTEVSDSTDVGMYD